MLGLVRQSLRRGIFLRQAVERVGLATPIAGKNYSTAVKELTVHDALNSALDEEMAIDPKVFIMGEKLSRGLLQKYGPVRVLDNLITEDNFDAEFAKISIGMTCFGLRPVVEFKTNEFSIKAIEQIFESAIDSNFTPPDDQLSLPIIFKGPNGVDADVGFQKSQAAEILSRDGISAEVINLRSLQPLDSDAIIASVKKTNRLVTVEEGFSEYGIGGIGKEIEYIFFGKCSEYLIGPIEVITGANNPTAELQVDDIVRAAKRACYPIPIPTAYNL